jgi:hypothetical protein
LISPAKASFSGIPTLIFSVLIPVIGVAVFTYIMAKRITPLISASPDSRFDRTGWRTCILRYFPGCGNTLRSGSFKADDSSKSTAGKIVDKTVETLHRWTEELKTRKT